MKKAVNTLLVIVLIVYLVPMFIYTTYLQLKNGSDITSRVESTIKGLLWPYYLCGQSEESITDKTDINVSNHSHVYQSLKYHKEASDYLQKKIQTITSDSAKFEDLDKYIELLSLSRKETLAVDFPALQKEDSLFAYTYKNNFIKGIDLSVNGYKNKNWGKIREGANCFARFLEYK